MLTRGFKTFGRGAEPFTYAKPGWRRARRRHVRMSRFIRLSHVALKHPQPDEEADYLSGDPDTLTPVEATELPDHVKDGLRMFRTAAAVLAPGRTVATQIRAVARALYPTTLRRGERRTKSCCYREAGPGIVLDFKYRFEAWRQKFVARHQAKAMRELEALAERRRSREAKRGRDPMV